MDDYSKVTYGMRDTLQLIRKDDNDALFRAAGVDAGKLVVYNLAWSVPIVVRKVNLCIYLHVSQAHRLHTSSSYLPALKNVSNAERERSVYRS